MTKLQMEKRDAKIRKMYSITSKKGIRKYSVRSLAEKIGLSKTRIGEIIQG